MNKAVITLLLALFSTGCMAAKLPVRTEDGVSAGYPAQASSWAEDAAREIVARYAAGSTVLYIVPADSGLGQFGMTLENELRKVGFAVTADPDRADVLIGYHADSLEKTGFWQLVSSDGWITSCSKPVRLP